MFTVSDQASVAIAQAAEQQEFSCLRISAESSGCSGLSYALNVELTKHDDDHVIDVHGVSIFIDPASMALLDGASMEFSAEDGGFIIKDPVVEAKGGCSCGK